MNMSTLPDVLLSTIVWLSKLWFCSNTNDLLLKLVLLLNVECLGRR
jgi:hypothetical protein